MGRRCETVSDVSKAVIALRRTQGEIFGGSHSGQQERVLHAFAALALLWERRLAGGWTPPGNSTFPWAQVRLSLTALLPGFAEAGEWLARSGRAQARTPGTVTALILAGNTPLLAWSPLAAALLAGHSVFVKQSRGETIWTALFVESLAEVDSGLASLIHLDIWPGADPRTETLAQAADTVIAYGGDAALAALHQVVPEKTPFFGFGHAVSLGIVAGDGTGDAGPFARDVLLYNQSGCLSAQALLVERGLVTLQTAARELARSLDEQCHLLQIPPVTDPAAAFRVRQARDMALFLGSDVSVIGDAALRWTLVLRSSAAPLEFPVGSCVVSVVPLGSEEDFPDQLGALRGSLSSVGVAGELTDSLRRVLLSEGVSRICPAGQMQMPPLNWPNGGKNLLAELMNVNGDTEKRRES